MKKRNLNPKAVYIAQMMLLLTGLILVALELTLRVFWPVYVLAGAATIYLVAFFPFGDQAMFPPSTSARWGTLVFGVIALLYALFFLYIWLFIR